MRGLGSVDRPLTCARCVQRTLSWEMVPSKWAFESLHAREVWSGIDVLLVQWLSRSSPMTSACSDTFSWNYNFQRTLLAGIPRVRFSSGNDTP